MNRSRRHVLKGMVLLPLSVVAAEEGDKKITVAPVNTLAGSWFVTSGVTSIILSIEPQGGALFLLIENGSWSTPPAASPRWRRLVEPEVVATSPYRIKSPVPVCCGFDSVKLACQAVARNARRWVTISPGRIADFDLRPGLSEGWWAREEWASQALQVGFPK